MRILDGEPVYTAWSDETSQTIGGPASEDPDGHIRQGVKDTTIKLSSSLTSAGKVRLTWKKSAGYRVDYYEVFRSTKKSSGYTSTPFYTTQDGTKTTYTNTKSLKKGNTYYYKVRGVRTIDGKKYYTNYSTKAWRTIR